MKRIEATPVLRSARLRIEERIKVINKGGSCESGVISSGCPYYFFELGP